MPRWQNLPGSQKETFVRGYSLYPTGGCAEFPWYHDQLEGFGSAFKREMQAPLPDPRVLLLPDPLAARAPRTTWTSTPR